MNRLHVLVNKCLKPVIGVVHIQATPGSPKYSNKQSISYIVSEALNQAHIFVNRGIDAIMIENMHDRPYNRPEQHDPITTSIMSVIGCKLRQQFPILPIGIQILTAANKEAMSVAAAADLDFIRCEGFVYGHLGDEGWIESCAASVTRYRNSINCNHIWILTDIKKKHSSHAVTSDVTLLESINAAEFFLSDAAVITGNFTGTPPDLNSLVELTANKDINIPIIIGSGMSEKNIDKYFNFADCFIVGSSFKHNNYWANDIAEEKVSNFMNNFKKLRNVEQK